MLTFMGEGDAYGAAFEFLEVEDFHPNTGDRYYQHPHIPLGNGRYTDDTQMAIAVVEAMLSSPKLRRQPDYAKFFFNAYKRDPRAGYGSGFRTVLDKALNVKQMKAMLLTNSERSGAVMRAPPIGGFADFRDVIEQARLQAIITHDTPKAVECAQAVALAFNYLYHNKGARSQTRAYLNHNVPDTTIDWTTPYHKWATVLAEDCALRALTVWEESKTTTEILTNSVKMGGDTDTVAAIAMALAWADGEIITTTHDDLLLNFEGGKFGLPFLHDLTLSWVEAFPKVHQ